MSLRDRNIMRPSKATPYKNEGRVYTTYGVPTLSRPLTDEEKLVEARLHEKYDEILGDFQMIACKNLGKSLWLIRLFDCREIETEIGPHELDGEISRWLKRYYPEVQGD